MKYCSKCGNELMDEAAICPKCGCPTESADKPKKKKGKGFKIILIVFGVLMVFYILGSLFGDNTSDIPDISNEGDGDTAATSSVSETDELAYECAIDLAGFIMDCAKNPHSMEIYELRYILTKGNNAMNIYLSYGLANSIGGIVENDTVVEYLVYQGEFGRGTSMETAELVWKMGGELSLPAATADVSDWIKLDVNVVKESIGLS